MSMFAHFDWAVAVLGLGSNVGDRMAHLQSAVDALDKHRDVDVLGVSPVYETEPVGGPDQDPYLNAVVAHRDAARPARPARRSPTSSRTRAVASAPSTGVRARSTSTCCTFPSFFDADTSALTLPHPRAHERAFVLAPWYDLDPDAELPGQGPGARAARRRCRAAASSVATTCTCSSSAVRAPTDART